jgi:BlaI family transcriptional regulator, penicillinase repressor
VSRGDADDSAPRSPGSGLGARQDAVLEVLWQDGESTVRQVAERLRAQGADVAYTTVLTLMTRLARRGLLVRRRHGRADLYRVAVERDQLGAALLREAVGRLLEAHGEAALAAFADRLREGDPAQLARLRALLEDGRP